MYRENYLSQYNLSNKTETSIQLLKSKFILFINHLKNFIMKQVNFTLLLFVVSLSASAIKLQGFETIANPKGDFFDTNTNFASIVLADNPKKEGINISDKVAGVVVHSGIVGDPETPGAPNSGIIKINFVETLTPHTVYPKNPLGEGDLIPVYYDVLRFKYYKGKLMNKNVEFEPNGQPTNPKSLKTAFGDDEWEYITFPLEFKYYQNFQIRVNRNENGTGSAVGTGTGEIIYVDDFEIYNSEAGPDAETAIKLTFEERKFSCNYLGGKSYNLQTLLEKPSNVKVELIALDGKVETIYNQYNTAGQLEVPFQTKEKGVYFVRVTMDNNTFEVHKVLGQ